MTEVRQGPTPHVHFREVSALKRCLLRAVDCIWRANAKNGSMDEGIVRWMNTSSRELNMYCTMWIGTDMKWWQCMTSAYILCSTCKHLYWLTWRQSKAVVTILAHLDWQANSNGRKCLSGSTNGCFPLSGGKAEEGLPSLEKDKNKPEVYSVLKLWSGHLHKIEASNIWLLGNIEDHKHNFEWDHTSNIVHTV